MEVKVKYVWRINVAQEQDLVFKNNEFRQRETSK